MQFKAMQNAFITSANISPSLNSPTPLSPSAHTTGLLVLSVKDRTEHHVPALSCIAKRQSDKRCSAMRYARRVDCGAACCLWLYV